MDIYSERREFVRMPSSISVQVCRGRKCEDGNIIDISPGGCQLVYGTDLEKGKKLKLRFRLNSEDPPVEIQGEVMWAKKGDGSDGKRYGIMFKEKEKFEKLGPMFLDYLTFKKKMDILKKEKRKEEAEGETKSE